MSTKKISSVAGISTTEVLLILVAVSGSSNRQQRRQSHHHTPKQYLQPFMPSSKVMRKYRLLIQMQRELPYLEQATMELNSTTDS